MSENKNNKTDKNKKTYRKPKLITEKVFASDSFGACKLTSAAQGCGRGPYQSS